MATTEQQEKLREYLLKQQARRATMESPEYRQSVNDSNMRAYDSDANNNFAALLMKSAAQAGTINGKTADASPVADFAKQQNMAGDQFRAGLAAEDANREKRYGVDAKVYEYLADKEAKKAQDEAMLKSKSDALSYQKNRDAKNDQYKRDYLATMTENKGAREKQKLDDKLDKQTHTYSEGLAKSNVPMAINQLEHVYTLLPEKGDAPGYGKFVGMAPDWMVSQKGEDLRQAVATLFNVELKDRSGAAVSDQELNRLKREFGEGTWKSPDQLRKGLAQYETRIKEIARNINAGTDPEAIQEYTKRGGRDFNAFKGRAVPTNAEDGTAIAGPKTAPPPAGKIRVQSSDGKLGLIPEEDLEQALKEGYTQVQ